MKEKYGRAFGILAILLIVFGGILFTGCLEQEEEPFHSISYSLTISAGNSTPYSFIIPFLSIQDDLESVRRDIRVTSGSGEISIGRINISHPYYSNFTIPSQRYLNYGLIINGSGEITVEYYIKSDNNISMTLRTQESYWMYSSKELSSSHSITIEAETSSWAGGYYWRIYDHRPTQGWQEFPITFGDWGA